jgi:hypothetical protein
MHYRNPLVRIVALVVMAASLAESAAADPPDILRNYRVIPRHSSLEVTGGFAGVHQEYDLFGKFGLVTGFTQDPVIDSPLPVLVPYARFVDVDVTALFNHLAAFAAHLPLEYFVDLEQLRSFDDVPPVLNFRGKDNQGAPFRLRATMHGRLLHLTGHNEPPCCDFFEYRLNALAYLGPHGDFNLDGMVDSADYTLWRDTMGSTTDLAADGNGDGVVDHADYDVWRDDTGTYVDLAALDDLAGFDAGFGSLGVAGVPEPSTFLLVSLAGAAVLAVTSRRPNRR